MYHWNSWINEFRKLKTLASKQKRFLGNKCCRNILKNSFDTVKMASLMWFWGFAFCKTTLRSVAPFETLYTFVTRLWLADRYWNNLWVIFSSNSSFPGAFPQRLVFEKWSRLTYAKECMSRAAVLFRNEPPHVKTNKWLCAQQRLRSAWASIQSDQSLRHAHNG